jgi:hypothetical protein
MKRWAWSTSRSSRTSTTRTYNEDLPENTMANAETWAAGMSMPAYAIDDQTAIKVTDGTVDVVSEGHWKLFTPQREPRGGGDGRVDRSYAREM